MRFISLSLSILESIKIQDDQLFLHEKKVTMSCKKYRIVDHSLFTQQIFAMYLGDFVVLFIFSKKKKCNGYGCKEFSTIEIKEYAVIMGNQFFQVTAV